MTEDIGRRLLRAVIEYHEGNSPYDFHRLPEGERANEAFDAWQTIVTNIREYLSLNITPEQTNDPNPTDQVGPDDTPDHCGWVHVPDDDEAWREALAEMTIRTGCSDLSALKAIVAKAPRIDEQMLERAVAAEAYEALDLAAALLGHPAGMDFRGLRDNDTLEHTVTLRIGDIRRIQRTRAALAAALGREG